jgi:hypothetical protein
LAEVVVQVLFLQLLVLLSNTLAVEVGVQEVIFLPQVEVEVVVMVAAPQRLLQPQEPQTQAVEVEVVDIKHLQVLAVQV